MRSPTCPACLVSTLLSSVTLHMCAMCLGGRCPGWGGETPGPACNPRVPPKGLCLPWHDRCRPTCLEETETGQSSDRSPLSDWALQDGIGTGKRVGVRGERGQAYTTQMSGTGTHTHTDTHAQVHTHVCVYAQNSSHMHAHTPTPHPFANILVFCKVRTYMRVMCAPVASGGHWPLPDGSEDRGRTTAARHRPLPGVVCREQVKAQEDQGETTNSLH